MSDYMITVDNQGLDPEPLAYTLVGAAPVVKAYSGLKGVSIQAWSNSYATESVAQGTAWDTTINKTTYAQCGNSDGQPLKPGTAITISQSQQATIGAHGVEPGSTHIIYRNNTSPAFRSQKNYTAPNKAFEIDTGADINPGSTFVGGYGLSNGDGITPAVATFALNPSLRYVIVPPPAPKFYLIASKSTIGTLIDLQDLKPLAEIDFAQHPGETHAIVTLDDKGKYTVRFIKRQEFAMRAARLASSSSDPSSQLTQLKHQVKVMSDLIDTALGISEPEGSDAFNDVLWRCSLKWTQTVPRPLKESIAELLKVSMNKEGYTRRDQILEPELHMYLTHPTNDQLRQVEYDWVRSWYDLPVSLKSLLMEPKVKRIYLVHDNNALDAPETTLPVLRPDYECSVEWLEGPGNDLQRCISVILENGMESQGYYTLESRMDDKILAIQVWHVDRPSVETVLAAWKKAAELVYKSLMGNYITNAKVEGIAYIQPIGDNPVTTDQSSNGQATADIFPPPGYPYICGLTWLEGPEEPTRHDITQKLIAAMATKGYQPYSLHVGREKLRVGFSHPKISDVKIATKDWTAARDTLGSQGMFTGNLTCREAPVIAGDDDTVGSDQLIVPRFYACSVKWLEGPNEDTQHDIMKKLASFMRKRTYYILSCYTDDTGAFLHVACGMNRDLTAVTADWNAACGSLDFQRMFVTDARCEPEGSPQAGNVSLSELTTDDSAAPVENGTKNGTNGVNGQDAGKSSLAANNQTQIMAPEVQVSAMAQGETMEQKKRRALALLQAEGLVGIQV